MRWLVDVVTLGKTDAEDSLHVEADSWQKALQAARAQRGESAPMSGFSIELLDDGCRAVDPNARLRYEVRLATEAPAPTPARPSSAPPFTTEPASHQAPGPPPSEAPSMAPPVQAATTPLVLAPRPAEPATSPPSSNAPHARPAPVTHRPSASVPAAPGDGVGLAQPRASVAPTSVARPSVAPAAIAPASIAPASVARPSVAPASIAPSVAPASVAPTSVAPRAEIAANVPCQVIFKREHEANDEVRLTYREYVFLVPLGTTEESAETLLRAQLALVLASLARLAPGKLVNLGVFDVAFHGKPPVAPLATLMWKDWRGDPVVEFPRRRGYVAKTSAPPPALTEKPHTAVEPASPRRAPPPPTGGTGLGAPSGPTNAAPPSAAPTASVPPAASGVAATSAPIAQPVIASPVDAAPAPTPETPAATRPAEAAAPVVAVPIESTAVPAIGPAPAERASEPARPQPARNRARGEDLIADLFDSMHELHFLRDAVEGGNFCLNLALEKIPSQAGIVHLYDINRREFLVTSTRGVAASTLLLRRHTETDALLAAAMRRRRALVVADAGQGDAASLERYAALGGAKSLIVVPVMQSGRFLGAIELLNPLDGQPYSEAEGNALMYIAEQFAEFVAARGIVTDPERISSRAG